MTAVSDRGLKPSQWTSARLHSEALLLETHQQRYELTRVDPGASSGNDATFVSTCCRPCQSLALADLPPEPSRWSCGMSDRLGCTSWCVSCESVYRPGMLRVEIQ